MDRPAEPRLQDAPLPPLRALALPGLLALTLPLAAAACDDFHDWRPLEDHAWRAPAPRLVADTIRHLMAQAKIPPGSMAILELRDLYAKTPALLPAGSTPASLSEAQRAGLERHLLRELEDELASTDTPLVSQEVVRGHLARGGEFAAYDPAVIAAIAEETGARHFLRLGLVRYSSTRVVTEDLYPANRGLYEDARNDELELRVAISDAAGDVLAIDELETLQTLTLRYWDRRRDGTKALVSRSEARFGLPVESWHSEAEHAGARSVGAIEVKVRSP